MEYRQFKKITEWQMATFGPEQSVPAKIEHLKEEIKEVLADLESGNTEGIKHEWADCFMLLFGAAFAYGYSYEDICEVIDSKFAIVQTRKYGEPKENGVINHIRDEETLAAYNESDKEVEAIQKAKMQSDPQSVCNSCLCDLDDSNRFLLGRGYYCPECLPF